MPANIAQRDQPSGGQPPAYRIVTRKMGLAHGLARRDHRPGNERPSGHACANSRSCGSLVGRRGCQRRLPSSSSSVGGVGQLGGENENSPPTAARRPSGSEGARSLLKPLMRGSGDLRGRAPLEIRDLLWVGAVILRRVREGLSRVWRLSVWSLRLLLLSGAWSDSHLQVVRAGCADRRRITVRQTTKAALTAAVAATLLGMLAAVPTPASASLASFPELRGGSHRRHGSRRPVRAGLRADHPAERVQRDHRASR